MVTVLSLIVREHGVTLHLQFPLDNTGLSCVSLPIFGYFSVVKSTVYTVHCWLIPQIQIQISTDKNGGYRELTKFMWFNPCIVQVNSV